MGCMSIAAHIGESQVLGIIPTAIVEENFGRKTVGEELRVQPCKKGYGKCLTILMPLLLYQVVLILWNKFFKSLLGLN
ncbi:hypothetical protein DITRI_Ditri05aG0113000 [Diplodiscus trichospermus]